MSKHKNKNGNVKSSEYSNKNKKEITDNSDKLNSYLRFYSNLSRTIINDLTNKNRNDNVLYKKYPKDEVIRMLENPQKNDRKIRQLSGFLYQVSSHYRRLIDYYSSVLLYNYIVIPYNLGSKINKKKFKDTYTNVITECDKYNFNQECKKAFKIAIRDGIYYGLWYETEDSFYIQPFNNDYAEISIIEDGCLLFSINLSYFSTRETHLDRYGIEIKSAYYRWKQEKKDEYKYFCPSNCICIKADDTDLNYSLPLFTGLLLSIYDIEDYKMLQKAKAENDNYKALALKLPTDEDGIPKMDKDLAEIYYNQTASNIAENIGLILTPFDIEDYSFQNSSTSERNAVVDAENDFWYQSGTSPLIFGSTKATSSSSLVLSVKPDEQIAMGLLEQVERFFNRKIKKMELPYPFKIKFLNQSIFNSDEISNKLQKAASYGVDGTKLMYASSVGVSPSDVIGLSFLENDILKLGEDMFVRPLISSNTLSGGTVSTNEGDDGRPTNESKGKRLTDEGENTSEKK